jgi:hypothetical protein
MICIADGCTKEAIYTTLMLCQNDYRKAKRLERGLKKPGQKPDPTKPYSRYNYAGLSHHTKADCCSGGHEYVEGSYKIRTDNKRICLICIEENRPTHCPQNHEYTPENTYFYKNSLQCLQCNRERQPWYKIQKKYGLSMEEYKDILEKQANKCALPSCSNSFDDVRPCVDHDHSCCSGQETCGKCVREIICINCNTALGQVKDNEALLLDMLEYIRKHKNK